MKRTLLPIAVCLFVALPISAGSCLYRYQNAACRQRGAKYNARVEKLKRDAHDKLKVGAKKDDVVHFFKENGIPVTFSSEGASGTIYTTGCAPSGCGSDDALIGLRVKVDQAGTVVAEPIVGAIYTNCL